MEEHHFETNIQMPRSKGLQETSLRSAARIFRESWIVPNSAWLALLLQNGAKAGKELATEMRRAYAEMRNDPDFEHLLSRKTFANALGASQTLGKGHCYLRHVPGAPAVLFLHGFGGNFLFYAWAMKQLLPACTIIHPSCGLDWLCRPSGDNLEYLDDLLKHLHQRIHLDLSNIWLAGISDGGVASFDIACMRPGHFRGLISIAARPIPSTPDLGLPHGQKILMINGNEDDRFPIGECANQAVTLAQSGADVKFVIINGGDHFFLLSQPEKMKTAMESFILSSVS